MLFTLLPLSAIWAGEPQGMEAEVRALKKEVLDLNRDLFLLEEELLFPGNTQFAVFLSVDVGNFFQLDAVELQVDGKEVSHHLYTQRELEALKRGGVQRLWLGNLKSGEHEITAFFTGKGPNGRDYKRGTTRKIDKGLGPKYVELQIEDQESNYQPGFSVREWE
ncbi:MAG TPA: AraC family transcriptional regulator [Chromatiales bacterium]|nr:AraC family transcriptional regulator [Kiloniellaceae bacterium]HIP53117.1 AraC family transcriptional regulator [Chromatiales bacterium]